MRRTTVLFLFFAAVGARADDNLQCPNGIASTGMPADEVIGVCGEPVLREHLGTAIPGTSYDEEWLYNFGPRQLLRIIRLRESRITGIEDDGYGFRELPKLSCDFYSLREGMSKFRLLYSCGKPTLRETVAAYRSNDKGAGLLPILRERWHYNSASGERIRTVIMENGRIVNVEQKKPRSHY